METQEGRKVLNGDHTQSKQKGKEKETPGINNELYTKNKETWQKEENEQLNALTDAITPRKIKIGQTSPFIPKTGKFNKNGPNSPSPGNGAQNKNVSPVTENRTSSVSKYTLTSSIQPNQQGEVTPYIPLKWVGC